MIGKISTVIGAAIAITFCSAGGDSASADKARALADLAALHNNDILLAGIDSDGADRIRLADRLTMLTQRVAAASCALTSDVAVEESHYYLEQARDEIDIILDALRHGNPVLHIMGPETNRRTLHDLNDLEAEWQDTHGAVDAVVADGHDTENAHIIDDHNLKLLHLATVLAADISGQYSHPYELSQVDAFMISLAGRQRMLTQRMAKDACEVWTGYHAEEGRADLEEHMVIFENSLKALRHGLAEAGVPAAPTPAIEKDLDDLLDRWAIIRGNFDKLLAGETLDMDQKYEIFHDFNLELDALDHLIGDYKDYAKRHHG
ncbi:MAG: type IV pili methyl-accepting chemotaxis transducer N-terminal domain-containing protein [Pseudomonadota bacterium]